ncbi:hydroxyacylglutathione hydrolase [Trypanosoma rangeli SC58]|uniref:Hydroxyacylglutathione hydrolase n=1 Tax=Trypanosoma rangeli SC58 TaxID=429131 RepID=A0A061J7K2_TRYRA|nr:hydroxyacylglutathione hydrolase [Trypanosoma rangeli SC58]
MWNSLTSPVARARMGLQQLIGPSLLLGGLGSLCISGIAGIPTTVAMTLFIYFSGIVPENEYFPQMWFKSNIFTGIYHLYCTDNIGYTYVRPMLHARQDLPHSDYRHGVRSLSDVHKTSLLFPAELKTNSDFYERGGGLVDLKSLGEAYKEGYRGVTVVPVPILTDNYAYLILSFSTKRCVAVDPADPKLVLYILTVVRHLTEVDFVLTDILTTHKHWDHAGGNLELQQCSQSSSDAESTKLVDAQLRIYGSVTDKPHACTNFVEGGEVLSLADGGVEVAVFSSPGHTVGSVMFLVGEVCMEPYGPQRLAIFNGGLYFLRRLRCHVEVTSSMKWYNDGIVFSVSFADAS